MKQYNTAEFPGIDILLLAGTIVTADMYMMHVTTTWQAVLLALLFQSILKVGFLSFLVFEYMQTEAKEYLVALPIIAYMFYLGTIL